MADSLRLAQVAYYALNNDWNECPRTGSYAREIVGVLQAQNLFIFYLVGDPNKYTSVVLAGGEKIR